MQHVARSVWATKANTPTDTFAAPESSTISYQLNRRLSLRGNVVAHNPT